ncbi:hypothetical protein K1719_023543 [Acacia pycnantha]|nr:hypothetical protein K1719_023543 [Acacia pycnantha]
MMRTKIAHLERSRRSGGRQVENCRLDGKRCEERVSTNFASSHSRVCKFEAGFYCSLLDVLLEKLLYIEVADKKNLILHALVPLINGKPSWRKSLRHVFVASISSFLFGYHLGVVNETLESISLDLGFNWNTMVKVGRLCFAFPKEVEQLVEEDTFEDKVE